MIAEICSVGADLPALFLVGGSLTSLVPATCPRLAYLSRQVKLGTSASMGNTTNRVYVLVLGYSISSCSCAMMMKKLYHSAFPRKHFAPTTTVQS